MSAIYEGESITTAAYLVKPDGGPYLISEISSWSVYVYDLATQALVYSLTGQTPTAIGSGGQFSNSPINDGSWPYGPPGYTFKNKILGGAFNHEGGHTLQIEYVVTTLTEGDVVFVQQVEVLPLLSS